MDITCAVPSFEMIKHLDLQNATKIAQSSPISPGSEASVGPGSSSVGPGSSSDEKDASCHHALKANKAAKKGKKSAICLDYLTGMCLYERYHCKYLHVKVPHLHPELGVKVCQTFILTGYCKFAKDCYNYHPADDDPHFRDLQELCVYGQKNKAKNKSKKAKSAKDVGSIETRQLGSVETAVRRANSILNSLPNSTEDAVYYAMIRLMSANLQLTMHHLVSLMFFKAMDDSRRQRFLYASLCKRLFAISDQSLQEISTDIMGRVTKLTQMLPVDASPQLQTTIFWKQLGCEMFCEVLNSKESC